MRLAKCVFLLYFLLQLISASELRISMDYYDELRSDCDLKTCSKACGIWPSTCKRGYCECYPVLARVKPAQYNSYGKITRKSILDSLVSDNSVHHIRNFVSKDLAKPLDGQSEKPALRHHIAHFCPDLEVARSCIKTCMKVGKPAFCGKDHVCYCSQKYSDKDKNETTDTEENYGQFRDLYAKYFGPNVK